MDCRALPPSALPHTRKLIHDYIENFSRLQNFFQHKPELHSSEAYARQLDFPAARRRGVAAILRADNLLFGSAPATGNNLRLFDNNTRPTTLLSPISPLNGLLHHASLLPIPSIAAFTPAPIPCLASGFDIPTI